MSIKSRLRPLHMRLLNNTVYEGLYLLVRPKARQPRVTTSAAPAKVTASQKAGLMMQGRADVISTMLAAGDYDIAKSVLRNVQVDEKSASAAAIWELKAELCLAQCRHDDLLAVTREMTTERDMPTGHYYAAQSYFARGLYPQAMRHIQACLFARPNHADCIYLLCELAQRTGKSDMGRDALARLVLVSRRAKSWIAMANLVETDDHFLTMQAAWSKWTNGLMKKAYNKDAHEYLALGAMRVDNYDLAKEIWRKSLFDAVRSKGGLEGLNVRKPSYSSSRAEDALSDLNATLRAAKIEMFLVSGTLLGCVREGKLLGHDKDIDVGIWSSVTPEDFFKVIHASGQFMILASRSEHIIRLKHLNGIAVDIFFHYPDADDYWHAGVKMKWSNTPFKLVEREFLGQTHLIPEDYDTYLKENYGDWVTPKIAFDSAFDTPNGTVLHEDEMVIHAYKGLMNACISGVAGAPTIYLDDLTARGEGAFVDRFRAYLKEHDPDALARL